MALGGRIRWAMVLPAAMRTNVLMPGGVECVYLLSRDRNTDAWGGFARGSMDAIDVNAPDAWHEVAERCTNEADMVFARAAPSERMLGRLLFCESIEQRRLAHLLLDHGAFTPPCDAQAERDANRAHFAWPLVVPITYSHALPSEFALERYVSRAQRTRHARKTQLAWVPVVGLINLAREKRTPCGDDKPKCYANFDADMIAAIASRATPHTIPSHLA